jgi:hypothetical protein
MALTPKENFKRIYEGTDLPEWVPSWSMGMNSPSAPVVSAGAMQFMVRTDGPPRPMGPPTGPSEWKDLWGVPYVSNAETGYAGPPKPGDFILEDVTKWDQVVKWPRDIKQEVADADWDAIVEAGLKDIDRSNKAVMVGTGLMPFQELMGLMGFTEGLCALLEEPESVKEMLNYIADYYTPIFEKLIDCYKPEYIYQLDDTASRYAPFFSMEVYKDVFTPIYKKLSGYGVERGIPVVLHNCGKCEEQIDEFIGWGVRVWDPAQRDNDLLAIKEKYKGTLGILGGWEFTPDTNEPITEELVRNEVRYTFDKYAPGGGYGFAGGFLGRAEDSELNMQVNSWIQDEVAAYGKDFYSK